MEPEKPISEKLHGVKLLVVEDDKFFRQLLEKKLIHQGALVTAAEDGQKALDAIKDGGFDLVVLDLQLPVVDGFEFLKKRKDNPKAVNIPVMVLSNFGEADQIKSAVELGVKAYLIKVAVTMESIVDEIAKVLEKN